MSLFHYAAEAGHWPLMEPYAREYCAHERYTDETLLLACRYGQTSVVEKLLQVHEFDKISNKALNIAAAMGHTGILEHLLNESGAYRPASLDEALILAASNGHEEALGLLWWRLVNTGSIYAQAGRNALSSAAANGHELVVRTLLKKGVEWGKDDALSGELSPLFCAAENGHASVVRALLDAPRLWDDQPFQSLIDDMDAHGESALHKAAAKGHEGIVKTLLEYGADPLASIPFGWKPGDAPPVAAIALAAEAGHERVVLVLLLHDFHNLFLMVTDIAPYRHEEMLRRLLESEWKQFDRTSIEKALYLVPESDIKYHTRMTALLETTLAKIDAEGRRIGEALSGVDTSDDRKSMNDIITRDASDIDDSVAGYTNG